ncbi:putative DNA-binding domain-containing protein [Novosphingobium humi]|uniref:DNA-binding domain-containing protein n=1 Tax=Novosphingobium humi TaxID=2282397 RepID=A0ABY7TYC2_9SPHN|nr:putative DNA-binding domain-containing protein [Novosphingobium humi]WCT77607.1 putative DNA-binding domain-containing protein [Novosphingobium humi]
MSSPETAAPPAMAMEFAGFCRAARTIGSGIYGQLLRENVADVLRASFPLFTGRIGSAALDAAIEAFIQRHPATRPQFHHIATEFLLFAQRQLVSPPQQIALLEYEWALLAAEIDAASVPPASTDVDRLSLNPTARLVLLQFDPARPEVAGDGVDRPYAIFRTASHQVLTLPLTLPDCLLVEHVRAKEAAPLAGLFDALMPCCSTVELQTSLTRGLVCGLFCPPQRPSETPHETDRPC